MDGRWPRVVMQETCMGGVLAGLAALYGMGWLRKP